MKHLKYFFQFILIIFFFLIFKIIGIKLAIKLSGSLVKLLGPLFRSKKLIKENILKAFPNSTNDEIHSITQNMWKNYGAILAEYAFIKNFRKSKLQDRIQVLGQEILEDIKINKERVIFISGHFNNFELMAMHIEKSGTELAAVYSAS